MTEYKQKSPTSKPQRISAILHIQCCSNNTVNRSTSNGLKKTNQIKRLNRENDIKFNLQGILLN